MQHLKSGLWSLFVSFSLTLLPGVSPAGTYNLAAAHGDKNAAAICDDLAKRISPAQIAEAQRLARAGNGSRRSSKSPHVLKVNIK
jgi:hypothetical protein